MYARLLVCTTFLAIATAHATPQAPAGATAKPRELTVAEIAGRRDLWPMRVAAKRTFDFGGGSTIRPGQELSLLQVQTGKVVLDTGEFTFEAAIGDTDVLERARALVASLTPEQLAVTWDTLRTQTDLWPVKVALTISMQLGDGTRLEAGKDIFLRTFDGASVSAATRVPKSTYFTVDALSTDLLVRARERVKLAPKEREPFFVRSLEAALDRAPGAPEHPLADADYLVLYTARKSCTRCAAFTPDLKEFYARTKPTFARFELVFVSSDANPEDARAYAADTKLPGYVLPFERRIEAADVANLSCQLLPGLFIVDRTGKVIEQNHPNGGNPSAIDVLNHFEKRLAEAKPVATK
jgi:hypothetical protein